jgi:hypothetical protein
LRRNINRPAGLVFLPAVRPQTPNGADLRPFHEADDQKQNDGSDRGVNDLSDYSAPDHDAQRPEHPGADESANDSDNDVTNQPKTNAFDDDTREPAGDRTDDDEDDQCLQ